MNEEVRILGYGFARKYEIHAMSLRRGPGCHGYITEGYISLLAAEMVDFLQK